MINTEGDDIEVNGVVAKDKWTRLYLALRDGCRRFVKLLVDDEVR